MFERDLPKREGESREKEERRGEVKGGVGGRLEERQAGGIDRDQGEEKSNKKPRDRQQREQRGGEREEERHLGSAERGGEKKLDTANLAVTFFPSFLSL